MTWTKINITGRPLVIDVALRATIMALFVMLNSFQVYNYFLFSDIYAVAYLGGCAYSLGMKFFRRFY